MLLVGFPQSFHPLRAGHHPGLQVRHDVPRRLSKTLPAELRNRLRSGEMEESYIGELFCESCRRVFIRAVDDQDLAGGLGGQRAQAHLKRFGSVVGGHDDGNRRPPPAQSRPAFRAAQNSVCPPGGRQPVAKMRRRSMFQ